MRLQQVIERLGYGKNEAKVYLALLSLGEALVSDIATKCKMPRSSVQSFLEKLHEDGLANFYERRRYTYWVAENPAHLLALLREREDELRAVMPQLEAMRHGEGGKPRVKVFEGVEEIRLIYDDMLLTRQHICGIIPWEDWVRLLGRGFMEDFIEKRVRQYLRIRLLTPRSVLTARLRERDSKELRETKYLPENESIGTTTLIYGSKVAIVSLNKKLPTAVVIEDAEVRDTLNVFFDCLWKSAQ